MQTLIDAAPVGGTVVLADDYTFIPADISVVSNDGVLISKAITIEGNGHTISGGGKTRVFLIDGVTGNSALTIKNLTVTEGGNIASGSAVFVAVSNNVANRGGGIIIDVRTEVTLEGCTITDNRANGTPDGVYGGGLLCHDGSYPDDTMKPTGIVKLLNTTISGNVASPDVQDDVYIHWSQTMIR